MEKKKETKRFDLMEFGSALGREEMKKLMAGSQGDDCDITNAVFCQCTSESTVFEECQPFDGQSPYVHCQGYCGVAPHNASWGISDFCCD